MTLHRVIRDEPRPAMLKAVLKTFDIRGMTCAACATRIERVLGKTPGITEARVNLALERADVRLAEGADPSLVIEAVTRAGYEATLRAADPAERRRQRAEEEAERRTRQRQTLAVFALSAVLTLPFLVSMGVMTFGGGHLMAPMTELFLGTLIQAVAGWRFYRGAAAALRGGSANMDVLVALGTTAAYLFSAFMVFTSGPHAAGHLYFEASATVLTLILAGKLMEARAKAGTMAAVRALMALRPERARRIVDGQEQEVGIEELSLGDQLLIRPGERVPVDGLLTSGSGDVDESILTGESAPVTKHPGDKLIGGAINGEGALTMKVAALGEDTTLARITRLIENAQGGKAPVQRMVDRISAIFVPLVLVIAGLSFTGWLLAGASLEQATIAAVSVLVIACPCALGLATPTALVAGTGAAARAGILIKDIDSLDRAAKISAVIFDKTGTLTRGHPRLVGLKTGPERAEDEVLRLAAAIQQASEHPLARAVRAAAQARGLDHPGVESFRAVTGSGAVALVAGERIAIGNSRLMDDEGVSLAGLEADLDAFEQEGRTAVFLARGKTAIGVLAFADPVRSEAASAIALLKKRNVAAKMLTGDNAGVAKTVASELGLDDWRGQVRPEEKADAVEALKKKGAVVAMVGDGVNDAPALAAADVGIAMGTGTDVAMETAGITLMRPDPRLVASALEVAAATATKIRQNLFWAFAFNVIGIPLAAFGSLTPAFAGAAMALSSIFVVSNAGLLTRWRPKWSG